MPELPDVETYRKYIESTALHKKINAVEISDTTVLKGAAPSSFAGTLAGHSFEQAGRHGKYCFLLLDDGRYLALHFGMTGFVKYYKIEDQAPKHTRITFAFENGYTMAYDSQRKLGQVELIEGRDRFIADRRLGPDAMDPDFAEDDFVKIISGRRGTLKSALMNQQILAGIGNVYSDEILFQEGLHPTVKVSALTEGQLRRIFRTMRNVLGRVIRSGTEPENIPISLITRHRGHDMQCPSCKGDLEKIRIGGRTSCFCPHCQRKR